MPRHFVVLGLGSNLGNRLEYLSKAVAGMSSSRTAFLTEVRCSEVFESEALMLPDSPADWNIPFFNIAVSGFSGLSSRALLERVKLLEQSVGRQARGRWAPREIDIDILIFGDARVDEEDLKIPHAALLQRPFALWPLAALAPELSLPSTSGSVSALEASAAWGFQRAEVPCATWRAPHEVQAEMKELLTPLRVPTVCGPLGSSELVGIINVTPDSFSDGGVNFDYRTAIQQGGELFRQGARVLDIGAESTRPGAAAVSADEEWQRLEPVVRGLAGIFVSNSLRPRISVDTRHAQVATRALRAGADWINDVNGFSDPAMIEAVKASDCMIVAMHSLGIPPSQEKVLDKNQSALTQILRWGEAKIAELVSAGIDRRRIIIDPGLGFGKTPQQSLELALGAEKLKALGARILIGHSRKSFLSLFTDESAAARDGETALLTAVLARQGIHYLRVHNVARNAAAIAGTLPHSSS